MDNGVKVRMSGYLHLKTKKRMISSWKNYWFVLEDRLLLYYRSKAEYETISPCKGSINLGPPCMVKSLPSVTNSFQVETRSLTYTLKADNSDDQKKWMQAILAVLNQNQNFPSESPKRLSHFRYSLDDLFPQTEPNDPQTPPKAPLERQNTLPHRLKLEPKKSNEIIQRLQKLGAQSYGGSLGAISKIATKKVTKEEKCKNVSQGSLPSCLFNEEDEFEEVVRPTTNNREENIYERISGDSQYSGESVKYSVPLRRGFSVSEQRDKGATSRETKSLLVENDQYATTRHVQSDEVIYAEPKLDCNKNSLLVENTFYASCDVVGHTNDNIYEDLDKYNPYSEPVLDSSQSSGKKEKIKKSKSFIRRVWKKKYRKQDEKKVEEEIYAEVDPTVVNKVDMSDDSAVQMLSELQNILENKKAQLRAKASNNPTAETAESTAKPEEEEEEAPKLPPKIHPPEQFRSLDEILEDLDREKLESKGKVQLLIEKFTESEPDVILRKHDKSGYRYSDDLNLLLDELAKVTSAPILTPGVTTSLVNPNLTDEEWLKLLPVRQRRLSEPDYDIPRPLKPVQTPEKSENTDVIPATRFFGPVLPPTIIDNKDESLCVSMTPDSLEIDSQKFQTLCSYTSHNYTDLKCFQKKDDVIYALPKSYLSTHIVNTCHNLCGGNLDECQIIYKNVKNIEHEEIFNDSLELCTETKTEF
ncbi:uncharacterized protein LOC100141985 isoform X2 [Tribolium castaneum]|uniref:uncharacterized protein LOC100141985 isoform X2 n=1 Tax=Tribolium castaneum TaxID=7070 RepID=UPI00077DB896|nr:PREDICTED: uncharacterized protein LOC100141985 isoform X2 [Tribolium castaneum]|eukprot:XP_015837895.1 PREDICTED: uncharacterized protein LOC100141985 isoform X2 [Tribolium castaneum]